MAQKQKKNTILLCTFRDCKEPQTDDGEYCLRHYAKDDRDDLKDALNRIYEMAGQLTEDSEELQQLETDYNVVFDFISNSEKS